MRLTVCVTGVLLLRPNRMVVVETETDIKFNCICACIYQINHSQETIWLQPLSIRLQAVCSHLVLCTKTLNGLHDMAIAGRLCNNVLRGFASKTALLSAPVQTQRAKRVRVCCDPWFFQDRPRFSTMPDVVRYQLGEEAQLVIQQGDITQWNGDAIVNAGTLSYDSSWTVT